MPALLEFGNRVASYFSGAAALWIFAALIHTMPVPLPNERWYGWFFNFLQTVGANLSKIGQKQR